jgi:uncharacterized membrane protein
MQPLFLVTERDLLLIVRTFHILAIVTYVGGSFFLDVIFSRAQQYIPPAQASIMGQRVGRDFAITAYASLFVIAVTGVVQMHYLNLFDVDIFTRGYGRWLAIKMGFWLILLVNGLIMTLLLRPRLEGKLPSRSAPEDAERKREDTMAAAVSLDRLVRVNLIISVAAVVVGASLSFGGPFWR